MERKPVILGIVAAAIALLIVKFIKVILGNHLAEFILEAVYNLPWLVGGFVTGYMSKFSPLRNGAITGALYGVIFSLIGIALVSAQTYGVQEKISQLSIATLVIIKFAFMFSLASVFGHLQKSPRASF